MQDVSEGTLKKFSWIACWPSCSVQCIFINTHHILHRQPSVSLSLRSFILQGFPHDTAVYYINHRDTQALGMESETHKADCCQDSSRVQLMNLLLSNEALSLPKTHKKLECSIE